MKIKNKAIKVVALSILLIILVVGFLFALPKIYQFTKYLINLFLPFIFAYFFALIVNPLMSKLQTRFKIPRGFSTFIVMLLLIGGLGGIITAIVIRIVGEFRNLYQQFPQIYLNMTSLADTLKDRLSGIYDIMPTNVQDSLSSVGNDISIRVADFINRKSVPMMSSAGTFAKSLPSIVISFIIFLLASFFMLSDFEKVKKVVMKPFSHKLEDKFAFLNVQFKTYLGGYFKAQGIIMSVAFFILFIGLSILKVEYSLIIALAIAIIDALPFFGSGAVLWPWCIISLINGDLKIGIGVIVIYVVLVITRQLIEPKIVSSKIGTNPLLTLMSMYVGYKVLSVGGMILGPIIMMICISFYKAGFLNGLISIIKIISHYIKRSFYKLKYKIINTFTAE